MFSMTAVLLAASFLPGAGERTPEEAFKEWGKFGEGGVWRSTDSKGTKWETEGRWILNNSFFISIATSSNKERWLSINGIDPKTRRWVYWVFDDKGGINLGKAESPKPGEYLFQESGRSKKGPNSWRARDTKIGPDQIRS